MGKIVQVVAMEPVGGVGSYLTQTLTDAYDYLLIETISNADSAFNQRMRAMGVEVHGFPDFKQLSTYQKYCQQWYQQHAATIDAVHIHSVAVALPHLYYAKKYGIKTRIYHAHARHLTDQTLKNWRNRLLLAVIKRWATHLVACGPTVGSNTYGGTTYDLLPNTIQAERFQFDLAKRTNLRQTLQLENKCVIGLVGSLIPVKNQALIVRLMPQLGEDYHLLIVGEGTEYQRLKELSGANVTFVGRQAHVADYYQAFDFFALPSLSEGFPYVALEAQASGLTCLLADVIDPTVQVLANCYFISNQAPDQWLESFRTVEPTALSQRSAAAAKVAKRYGQAVGQQQLSDYYRKVIQ